ncbi:MAG: hypothetical protein AB7O97_07560 [Planctomycetota bacterium]
MSRKPSLANTVRARHLRRGLGIALLLAGAAAAAGAQAPAGDVAAASQPSAWLPIQEGALWTYRCRLGYDPALPLVPTRAYVQALGRYRDGSRDAWLMHTTVDAVALEHWFVDAGGLEVRAGYTPAAICVARADVVSRPLAGPVGAVTEWQWRVPEQEVADAEPPPAARDPDDGDDLRQHELWTAHVAAFEDEVTVPAGTFRALIVRATAAPSGATAEWCFARGTGLVRSEVRTEKRIEIRELEQFAPGLDGRAPRTVMLELLPPEWLRRGGRAVRIEWLADGVESLALPGRFAQLDLDGQRRFAFVGRDCCLPLDPSRSRDWRALIERVEVTTPPSAPTLARLVARLLAARDDRRIAAFPELHYEEWNARELSGRRRAWRNGLFTGETIVRFAAGGQVRFDLDLHDPELALR